MLSAYNATRDSFSCLRFVPRVNRPVKDISSYTSYFGGKEEVPLPIWIAPTGQNRNGHPDGELASQISSTSHLKLILFLVNLRTLYVQLQLLAYHKESRTVQVYRWLNCWKLEMSLRKTSKDAQNSGIRFVYSVEY